MKLNSRKLFLIDGVGALISALFLGVILAQLQTYIGMPTYTLYLLAILAALFAIYSFGCYLLLKEKWDFYLRIIAIVNLCYCLLTLSLVIINFRALTMLGLAYFVLEMLVILVLVRLELASVKVQVG